MHYYQHNIGDFDKSTRHLTRVERSVYRDLIELYYDTEHQLTLDMPKLCRRIIAISNEEVTAVEQVLSEFFTKTEIGYYHDRCEQEIERFKTHISQRSEAGRKSAAARQEKRQRALKSRSTKAEQACNETPTNQEPLTNNQETDKDINVVSAACESTDVFEHWKALMKHPKAKLDPKRMTLIRKALKLGYSVDELKSCITGYTHSPFHMGDNDRRTRYDNLELILRDAGKIDFGLRQLELAHNGEIQHGYQDNTKLNRSERLQVWAIEQTAEFERQLAELDEQERARTGNNGDKDLVSDVSDMDP